MNRFQKWALATTIATFLLIFVGGMVRASDAGLGCPDWPKCFDRYYPPLSESQLPDHIDPALFDFQTAWIEYTNRIIGVIIGFLILGTTVLAIRHYRHYPRILYPTVGAFVLVLVQGWLGGQVVESKLDPMHITAHLLLAWIIVNLLLYATVEAFFPNVAPFEGMSQQRRTLGRIAVFFMILTLVQAGLGAELRGELEVIERDFPQLARSEWFGETGVIDPIHRSFSWLILFTTIGLNWFVWKRLKGNTALIAKTTLAISALVGVQIIAGIGMAYGGVPPVLQVVHLIAGSLLIGGIMLLYLLAGRVPEESEEMAAEPPSQNVPLSQQIAG